MFTEGGITGMTTERIYQQHPYAIGITAVVTDVYMENDKTKLVFDRTVFFPEGGGQPCDLGWVTTADGTIVPVTDVRDGAAGAVVHEVNGAASLFKPGDRLTLEIDFERRFINMQRHTGEHILSGVFYKYFGGNNKGFHIGEDYIAIDIEAGGRMYDSAEIKEAERLANQVIWDNLPVSTVYYENAEAASAAPARKAINIEGEVSVVTIGDEAAPADCCACCGTHLANAGEVGIIKIYKTQPNKGMNRIFFDVGIPAFERCVETMDILTEITNRFSTSNREIFKALDAEAEKSKLVREKLSALTSFYSEKTSSEISEYIRESLEENLVLTHHTNLISADELLKLGFRIIDKVKGNGQNKMLLIMVQDDANTAVLISNGSYNCGALVKEHAFSVGGRGGGKDDNARAVFPSTKELRTFLDRLNALQ